MGKFNLAKEEKAMFIFTVIILAVMGLGGLALDAGLVYIERRRLTRVVDTATLAAVVELPYEQDAIDRAIEYIKLNGYRVGQDTEIRVRGCLDGGGQLRNVDAAHRLYQGAGFNKDEKVGYIAKSA